MAMNADGTKVVTVDGKRVDGPGLDEAEAQKKAEALRKKLSESEGQDHPPVVEIKTNILG